MPRNKPAPPRDAPPAVARQARAQRLDAGADAFVDAARALPEEVPVALAFNGVTHAVMLASPGDLEDFGTGFALSEGIVATTDEILDLDIVPRSDGIEIGMRLTARRFAALSERRRSLAGPTGCGLCGVDSLAQANRQPPGIASEFTISEKAIRAGLQALPQAQTLNERTGAAHAAAWVDAAGNVVALREDVGRHNALDKLIGALARSSANFSAGAALLTSRCSVELVMKAASLGMPVLVAVSAPTARAVQLAQACNVTLVALARTDSMLVFAGAQRLVAGAGR
ncbi:MAG: formate dehydrogenase accessory sulfurtransferase FdhD [Reyranellaceae bacterium]